MTSSTLNLNSPPATIRTGRQEDENRIIKFTWPNYINITFKFSSRSNTRLLILQNKFQLVWDRAILLIFMVQNILLKMALQGFLASSNSINLPTPNQMLKALNTRTRSYCAKPCIHCTTHATSGSKMENGHPVTVLNRKRFVGETMYEILQFS